MHFDETELAELIPRVQQGDATALAQVVERIRSFFLEHTALEPDVEQEFMRQIVAGLSRGFTFRTGGAFARWLLTVRLNTLRTFMKSARHRMLSAEKEAAFSEMPAAAEDGDPLFEAEQAEEVEAVRRCIGELSGGLHSVMIERDFRHQTFAAVGARLKLAEATARARYARALVELRRCLQRQGLK